MDLLNYKQASEFLSVPRGTLYSWVHHRTVPFVRMSKRVIRFDKAALTRWVDAQRLGPETSTSEGGMHPRARSRARRRSLQAHIDGSES